MTERSRGRVSRRWPRLMGCGHVTNVSEEGKSRWKAGWCLEQRDLGGIVTWTVLKRG